VAGPNNPLLYYQAVDLRKRGPGTLIWKSGRLTWTGSVQPTALSEEYLLRVTWDGRRPRIHVLRPGLENADDTGHTFPDGTLCLHYNGEWSPGTLISGSILPWASEWLYFYELWLATGEWLGGGHEAPKTDAAPALADDPIYLAKRRNGSHGRR